MVVALLNVAAVLLVGLGILIYRRARRGRPAPPQPRRVSLLALEGAATIFGLAAIVISVTIKIVSG
jgi:hypothetical protein